MLKGRIHHRTSRPVAGGDFNQRRRIERAIAYPEVAAWLEAAPFY